LSGSGARERDGEPEIGVYATGGTIASTGDAAGDGIEPKLSAAELVAAVPGLGDPARFRVVDFRRVPSVELTLVDVVALATSLDEDVGAGVEGFVVTQGTDTLEEVAFGVDLLWTREQPVVFTGAMRGPGSPGADGPANIAAAVAVASSPAAHGIGCLVVMNDEIHAARHVQKTHPTSPAAFGSPLAGPVGGVTEGRVRIWSDPRRHPPLPRPEDSAAQPPVALLRVGLGDDGRALRELPGRGYLGAVVESMGAGHVPRALVEPLAELSAEVPVVLASRTGSGEGLRETYGFPGAEIELLGHGLLTAGTLDGLKARVKLSLLLMGGASRDEIATAFDVGASAS
jgi:L-asparaginase